MSFYDEQMRELLTCHAGDWLRAHGFPRAMAVFAMSFGLLASFLSSCGLMSLGLADLPTRFAINSVCGYLAFVAFLACWFLRVSPVSAESLQVVGLQQIKTAVPGDSEFDKSLDEGMDQAFRQSMHHEGGPFGVFVAIGLIGILAVAVHFVVHAPWYFGKLMVDGGKVRHRSTPLGNKLDFLVLPLRQTWPVAVMVVLHYTTVGAAIQYFGPKH